MPGQDRTGPAGKGPKTGKGQGKCGNFNRSGKGSGCNRTGRKQGSGKGGGRGSSQGRCN